MNTPGIFVWVRQYLVRRCHFCIEVCGRQFEQLLQDAKWYVNCVNVLYLHVTVTNINKQIDSNVIDKFTAISP